MSVSQRRHTVFLGIKSLNQTYLNLHGETLSQKRLLNSLLVCNMLVDYRISGLFFSYFSYACLPCITKVIVLYTFSKV